MIEVLAGLSIATVVRYTAPVALAALGETLGEKAGLLNVGIEGIMLMAAYVAMLVSQTTGSPWLGLLAGALAGMGLGALQALFTVNLAADQVVAGTAVNLLALGTTGTWFALRYGQGELRPVAPKLSASWGAWDLVMLSLLPLAFALVWLLGRTRWGLAVRAAGEFPYALEAAGRSVLGIRTQAAWLAALAAGLGGAYLSLGTAGSFAENMTAGRGFVAIAMVAFGRWKPFLVLAACLLVGLVESLQWTLQARLVGVPKEAFLVAPYVVALLVLVAMGKGALGPAALARGYRKRA